MSRLDRQLREDRALRDAAKAVLLADLEHTRGSLSVNGLTGRVGERIGDGARDVFEVAKTQADDNRGIIAALIGAILLWLGREPLLDLIFGEENSDGDVQAEETSDGQELTMNDGTPEAEQNTPGDDHDD